MNASQDRPQSIVWQGITLKHFETKTMFALGKPYVRHEFRGANRKQFFYDFGDGVDWKRLEAANRDVPEYDEIEASEARILFAQQRQWRG